MSKATWHFPVTWLRPEKNIEAMDGIGLRVRRWETSTFDLATLATKHRLAIPYQVMDVLLGSCNCEFVVPDSDFDEAVHRMRQLRLMLYADGVAPFFVPYGATAAIDDYSGINQRDSGRIPDDWPSWMRDGPTSSTVTITVRPVELRFHLLQPPQEPDHQLGASRFRKAVERRSTWEDICGNSASARVFGDTVDGAPHLYSPEQATLHLWTGLESLFPTVNAEVSFRLALLLACLQPDEADRRCIFDLARQSYRDRSKVAHGHKKSPGQEGLVRAWELCRRTLIALLERGLLPVEETLVDLLVPAPSD